MINKNNYYLLFLSLFLLPCNLESGGIISRTQPENQGNQGEYNEQASEELLIAARIGDFPAAVQALADHADPNIENEDNFTALDLTLIHSYYNITQQLLNAGADINLKNQYGHTPLHIALFYNKFDAMQLLIVLGADPNLCDNKGFSILCWAVFLNNIEVVQFLLDLPMLQPTTIEAVLNELEERPRNVAPEIIQLLESHAPPAPLLK